ncbi:MAG: GNAT family N-acetyltransferase [Pseudomonadota bacterium]
MTGADPYVFRPATAADHDLLCEWQARPHVRAWWDAPEPDAAAPLPDPRVVRWIVEIADRPFAYMQDYTVHGWADHPFFHLPTGARGIDQFIGEADMVGKGHGPGFITARLMTLFADGAPVVATDPHPDNARAIAAYRKAGFRQIGPPRDTRWGRILPMTVTPSYDPSANVTRSVAIS